MTKNKTWLVTGCSSGFGYSLAEKILSRGDTLLATARQPGQAQQLQTLQNSFPNTCHLFPLDLSQPSSLPQAISSILTRFPQIDILINNAGYGLLGSLEESSEEQIRRNFEVNFFGATTLIRHLLPLMRQQRSGHIINISAAAAINNYAGFSIYGASKWALEGLSESLAAELRPCGIKVTLIQPGPFRTDFISRSMDRTPHSLPDYQATVGKFSAFLEKMNGQQPGDPAKAAAAILHLTDSENPPLRLTLGKYAHEKVERCTKTRLRELETWKEIGLATDF
jgi:NAD(P)-dependent dehydrogenase (short-subunit alcohol dehydrogenase family)